MFLEQILKEKGAQIYSVAESATLKECAELLETRRVGAMVVLNEGGGLIGVVSERDLVRNIARIGAAALNCTVGEVMTRKVETARPRDTIESAMERMPTAGFATFPWSKAAAWSAWCRSATW